MVNKNPKPNPDPEDNGDQARVGLVSLKLPTFWKNRPELWFRQIEVNFSLSKITQYQKKYDNVLTALDGDTLEQISDIKGTSPSLDIFS